MSKKRIIIIVSAIITIIMFSIFLINKGASPAKDFEYEMNSGEVTITAYVGIDRRINIPRKINGRPVTVIAQSAFQGYDMKHISIPDTVKEIHSSAFERCGQLRTIKWSKSLEFIGADAFSYCRSLKKAVLPESLLRIQDDAFYSSGIKKVVLPESLEYIGTGAFAKCDNLAYLELPDSVDLEFYTYTPNYIIDGYDSICEFTSPVGKTESGIYSDGRTEVFEWSNDEEFGITTEIIISENAKEYDKLTEYSEKYGLLLTVK